MCVRRIKSPEKWISSHLPLGFDFFDGAVGDGGVDFYAFEFGEDGFEGGDGLVG